MTSAEILGERQSWMWGIRELGILGAGDQEGKATRNESQHAEEHNAVRLQTFTVT